MNTDIHVTAVIVAAGNSTRMKSEISKQFIKLLSKPVIGHTLSAFEKAKSISEIVVVCREADRAQIEEIIMRENVTKVKAFAVGGVTRSDSVAAGIGVASDKTTHFAIHDGARPLILSEDIDKVVEAGVKNKAAALGVPVTDTIKVVDEDGFIISTPLRSTLRAAQTPQVFEKSLYLSALDKNKNADFTDDCALVETVGAKVLLVIGDYTNIKVTTPQDVPLAEGILRRRAGEE